MKTIEVTGCYRCPFAEGMGDSEQMPSFPRCSALDRPIEISPNDLPGAVAPSWCPLRQKQLAIMVRIRPVKGRH